LDIEFFLVRLPVSSATLVPAPRPLLDQPTHEQPQDRLLYLERWNSSSPAKIVRMAGPAGEALEDLLLGLIQTSEIIWFFGFVGAGALSSAPGRRRVG